VNHTRKAFIFHRTTETYFDVGTVGAVAINSKGQIAVATSTGNSKLQLHNFQIELNDNELFIVKHRRIVQENEWSNR